MRSRSQENIFEMCVFSEKREYRFHDFTLGEIKALIKNSMYTQGTCTANDISCVCLYPLS